MLNSWWISSVIYRFFIVLIEQSRFSHLLGSCCALSIFAMTSFCVIVSMFPQTSPVVSAKVVCSLNFRGSREVGSRIKLCGSYFANLVNEILFQCETDVAYIHRHGEKPRSLEIELLPSGNILLNIFANARGKPSCFT